MGCTLPELKQESGRNGWRRRPREHPHGGRISASERTREELRALIDGRLGTAASRSDLVRLAVRLIVEEALDAEATEAVGRERYERAAAFGIPERVSDWGSSRPPRAWWTIPRRKCGRRSSRFPRRSARRWPGAPRRSRSLRSSSTPAGFRRIRIGISGWTYGPWRGRFYPKGLPRRRELALRPSASPRSRSTAPSTACSAPRASPPGPPRPPTTSSSRSRARATSPTSGG